MKHIKDKISFFEKNINNKEIQDNIEVFELDIFSDSQSGDEAEKFNLIEKKSLPIKNDLRKGHRIRVKKRFLHSENEDSFLDEDLIEMMLFYIKPMVDVKILSKQILEKFKNIDNFFNAKSLDLEEFFSNTESVVFFLKLIRIVNERRYKNKIKKINIISNWQFLIQYLQKRMGILKIEELRVIYLDSSYKLIEDRAIGTGTVDEISVYIREIITKAIGNHAKFFVIAHNHPSGICQPSKADIELTKNIQNALIGVDINLLDHIILVQNQDEYFSFKEHGLIR